VRGDLKSIPSGVAQRNSVDPTGEPTFPSTKIDGQGLKKEGVWREKKEVMKREKDEK